MPVAFPASASIPTTFTPSSSKYAGEACNGVFMVITDRTALQPVRMSLEIVAALTRLHGERYQLETTARLFGSRESLERVTKGEDPAVVASSWGADEARWRQTRAKYLAVSIGRRFAAVGRGGLAALGKGRAAPGRDQGLAALGRILRAAGAPLRLRRSRPVRSYAPSARAYIRYSIT